MDRAAFLFNGAEPFEQIGNTLKSLIHSEKMTFQHFPHTNAWGRKFDLAVKMSKVNLRSSFEQTR